MKFPNKGTVEKLRKVYPVGTRVELVSMDDFQAPPLGTKGIVKVLMIQAVCLLTGITEAVLV